MKKDGPWKAISPSRTGKLILSKAKEKGKGRFTCGENVHYARECPKPPKGKGKSEGKGKGKADDRLCYNLE